MIKNTNDMTSMILVWASRNLEACNEYSGLKTAIDRTLEDWKNGGVDISINSIDEDVQSCHYFLKRVKECSNLFEFLDFKDEVNNALSVKTN